MGIKDILFNHNNNFYDNFPDAIIVLDFMRNIILWNKKAEILFGYTKSEIRNKNISLIFSEDFEKFNKIVGLNHGSILKATTKNAESIFVDVTAYDMYNSAKTIISIRALSNKFLELQSLLDDYQTTKLLVNERDSFLSDLKFDFLTPINAAVGFSQSLLDNTCGDLNEKQQKYINIINTNNKKVQTLLDKVFEVIELDAGKKEFIFKNFDFTKILDFSIEKFNEAVNAKGLKIIKDILIDKKTVYSDEYAFARVVDILLDNAVKFTSKGTIQINVSHPDIETLEHCEMKSPAGYTEKSYLQVQIADTGIGITEEQSKELFDEYSVKKLNLSKKSDGIALSLPIATKIIHQLHGAIWYSPNDNEGSIFTFIIPIERMTFE